MEEQVRLKAYKKEVELLTLSIDIPYFSEEKERLIYGTYEGTLLKLFNNQRENKNDIVEIRNYYDNDTITVVINLTNYREDSLNTKREDIDHLKNWLIGNFDIKPEEVRESLNLGHIYEINEYNNNIDSLYDYVRVVY